MTVADGCPTSVGGHTDYGGTSAQWIDNPDAADLANDFVPDKPTQALVCRYASLGEVSRLADGSVELNGGDLYSSTVLGPDVAVSLAATVNAIVPWNFVPGCVPPADEPRYTAIVFAIPGRGDVDLWLKDWLQCPEVGNGARTSGLLVNGQGRDFLTELDSVAPPAPEQCSSGC